MFNFGNANENQKKAISTIDGPLLITAGPGTGKTYTLVQRAIYLITEKKVNPEEIFIATFTEKAAKELITRITNELICRNIVANTQDLYIGTFHSLCLRILKENLEFTRLKKNYKLLDDFDQKYMIFRNISKFREIENIDTIINPSGKARTLQQAEVLAEIVSKLTEEMVDVEELAKSGKTEPVTISKAIKKYQKLLEIDNALDFSSIQTECYRLLTENHEILNSLQQKIKYIMVDEYQDTNYIQEQIIFLLGKNHGNICVVGDDDQGLYRFRGATIRNILEFPHKFSKESCKIIPLDLNYRSNKDIVSFYNNFMANPEFFSWDKFRYKKTIVPNRNIPLKSPAVIKISDKGEIESWCKKVFSFVKQLILSGKLQDYNQIAFLFNSVKSDKAKDLANFLEKNGIKVYSPRSAMFFDRDEIMCAIGTSLLLFPNYVTKLKSGEYKHLPGDLAKYYDDCISKAQALIQNEKFNQLKKYILEHMKKHLKLKESTDYTYSGLLYQMFAFEPFKEYLNADLDCGVVDIRPTRNIAILTQLLVKFEYIHNINIFKPNTLDHDTELLFNLYMKLLFDGGINEYEDEAEYAPKGCVSFLTIHQSKGLEFPVVFVDSLSNVPRNHNKDWMIDLENKYFKRRAFEPHDQMKYFDFWRLYYTAFSRAQDLLVLTYHETERSPSKYFSTICSDLPDPETTKFDINDFTFNTVKDVNLKETFSFTSHISLYETCPRQYKFLNELQFMPIRENAMVFGLLVHGTIEDMHKVAIRKEAHLITEENITNWFYENYTSLVKREHTYLREAQQKAALSQVLAYAKRQENKWDLIQDAEVDVSLVQKDYIIGGKIDLIKGDGDTVVLIDFKTERKPDMEKMKEKIERYRKQLNVYAYLVEKRLGKKVSKMHLYYTSEEEGNPVIPFDPTNNDIEETIASFDDTVHKILKKDFSRCAENPELTCRNCDFRFYCRTISGK